MNKPLIALNADYRDATTDGPAFSYIASGYFEAVLEAGGVPLILPPIEDEDDLGRILDMVDGVVLVGGADLDPRRDGWMLHPSVRLQARRREDFDRMLIHSISERRVPVLGIGAGMQLLNVSHGGNLFLHLPEDCPDALPHRDPMDRAHRHGLVVTPGSLMERIYGDGELRVNSMHHMAIDEVASGFDVTARSPDGIVEAIESVMPDWFALGTQFHPEAESATAIDGRIFEEFVDGVRETQQALRLIA